MSDHFQPINWSSEPISADKLNQMAENDQYLYERTPTVFYNAFGLGKRTGGVKILAGVLYIPANKKATALKKDFNFGNFFSQGCRPVVVASLGMSRDGRFHCYTEGYGKSTPDHRGVRVGIVSNNTNPKNNSIHTTMYVNIIAVGY